MPFRYASHGIVAMIAITILAFWPGYFSVLTTSPWGFHLHGLTATLWMVILALQSWSIHHRRRALHRTIGLASLIVFPIFLVGTVAVVLSMAQATPGDAFYRIYGARLGIMDATSPLILAWLYYHALAERRSVQLHARYMLATPLLLIMPIVSRLTHFVPALHMHGPQDWYLFAWSLRLAKLAPLLCAAGLYATAPRYGRPFLVAGAAMLAQAILSETFAFTAAWQAVFARLGTLPPAPTLALATIAGAALSWAGWIRGAAPKRPAPPLAEAAA